MAKKIISVTVKTKCADIITTKSDLVAVAVFSGEVKPDPLCRQIDKKLGGAISNLMEMGDFKAKAHTTAVLYTDGKIAAKRVLLIGMGERAKSSSDSFRDAAAIAADRSVGLKAATVTLAFHAQMPSGVGEEIAGQILAEGIHYGAYRFDEFKTDKENGRLDKLTAVIVDGKAGNVKGLAKGVKVGVVTGQAQMYARTIANQPGNVINPGTLAAAAKKMAAGVPGLSCKVYDEKQLKQIKAGGILAVGGGSATGPRMIVLKYKAKSAKAPTVGLVGKAVTFDSGGIDIKGAAGMDEMKFDKSGGIAVLGAMQAIAKLKPAVNVYGIIPSAENMPGGRSYRPGDIVTTMSGKTVEILNTDAEGRMILCDGIDYAVKNKCDTIIDIATLTGSCVVALGKYMAGLMSNDDGLLKDMQAASSRSGEKVWHLPCTDDYLEDMKSKVADLRNAGTTRWGGASMAAAFLREFAAGRKWAHIDMAGMEIFAGHKNIGCDGSPGFGVRLLTDYVMNVAK
ncbi:MAG: leucyl aminopeptidase [Anaerohalosphaera sp.]|nr:leucyl aminopeptidase [Anaerohalosphaera sp.]